MTDGLLLHGRHLAKLSWVEIKIFLREPMGAIGTIVVPVVLFMVLGRVLRGEAEGAGFVAQGLPVFAVIFIAIGAVLSLTTIIAIYREGGILKRLHHTARAEPAKITTLCFVAFVG